MKRIIYFSFLLFLLITSCKNDIEYKKQTSNWPIIDDIFVMMDSLPDSASIMKAVCFYDSVLPGRDYSRRNKDLSFQKARVYYYKALMEQMKTNQHVEAFADYLNALWVVEGMKGERSIFASKDYNLT